MTARRSTIADDGPGIADADKESALSRGVRLDTNGGSGLGLAIVSDIVDAYGGRLTMTRRGAGAEGHDLPAFGEGDTHQPRASTVLTHAATASAAALRFSFAVSPDSLRGRKSWSPSSSQWTRIAGESG